jgi:hypothetical protein
MSPVMPRVFRRETFIALRARRQAYAIARDIIDPHVDVAAVPCRACGGDVPFEPYHLATTAQCPACGAQVVLPANFLAEMDGHEDEDDAPRVRRTLTGDWRAFHWVVALLLWMLLMTLLVAFAVAVSPL